MKYHYRLKARGVETVVARGNGAGAVNFFVNKGLQGATERPGQMCAPASSQVTSPSFATSSMPEAARVISHRVVRTIGAGWLTPPGTARKMPLELRGPRIASTATRHVCGQLLHGWL